MKAGSYECHVTLEPQNRERVEELAKEHKFKVSALVGDEEMGDDKLLYCTTHDSSKDRIIQRMNDLVLQLRAFVKVLRIKVEEIVIDERFK